MKVSPSGDAAHITSTLQNNIDKIMLVVEAHVLGLIYYANQENLGWVGEGEK